MMMAGLLKPDTMHKDRPRDRPRSHSGSVGLVDVVCHWTDPIVVMLRGWLADGAAMLCGAIGRPRRLLI